MKGNLESAILMALHEYFESRPGSPKMTFTELYKAIDVDKKQRGAVSRQLFYLQNKGWIKYESLTDGLGGLAEIAPEGIQVAQDRQQLMTSASEPASSEVQQDDESKRNDADRGEPPPTTNLEDLIQKEPNCAGIFQRQALVQKLVNCFEQKVSHFIVLSGQPMVGKTKILNTLSEMLKEKYVPLTVTGQGMVLSDTLHDFDLFVFDLADQLTNELETWEKRNCVKMLKPPSWDKFKNRGRAAFERHWDHLIEIAKPYPPLLMFDEVERLLDFPSIDPKILPFLHYFVKNPNNGFFILTGSERIEFSTNEEFSTLIGKGKRFPVHHYDDKTVLRIFSHLKEYLAYEDDVLGHCLALCDGQPRILRILLEETLSLRNEWPNKHRIGTSDFEQILTAVLQQIKEFLWALKRRLSEQERLAIKLISQKITNPINQLEIRLHELVALAARQFPRAKADYNFIKKGVVDLAEREWVEWKDRKQELFRFKLGIFLLWLDRYQIKL